MSNEILGEVVSSGKLRGMKLVRKKVADLIPFEANTKMHPEHQVADIAKSIQNTGFCDPITVDEHNNIIDGHGRRLALLSLGIEEVPCIVLPMNAVTQRAYGIAHNQTTLSSSFDYKQINQDLIAMGLTLDDLLLAGFDRDTLRLVAKDDLEANLEAVKEFKEDSSGWKEFADDVYKFDLEFATEDEQYAWMMFLTQLKQRYPDKETISDRIMLFIKDTDVEEQD